MVKVKANYDDVEVRELDYEPYEGEVPTNGVYTLRLTKTDEHPTENSPDGLQWIFVIHDGPYAGCPLWLYSNLSSTNWKTKQITDALGWTDPDIKGDQPWDSDAQLNKGKLIFVKGKVRRENYEGEAKPKLGNVFAIKGDLPDPVKAGKKAKAKKKSKKGGSQSDLTGSDDPF